jgi:hypothetical protein
MTIYVLINVHYSVAVRVKVSKNNNSVALIPILMMMTKGMERMAMVVVVMEE